MNFETRLLDQLQQIVAEQPAAAPPGRRRRLVPALAGATAVAGVAAGVLVVTDAGSPTAAWAVDRSGDGTVTVTIRSPDDAAGLERELGKAGVRAQVDFLPAGQMCREPRFKPAGGGRPKFTAGQRVLSDGSAEFTLDRRALSPGDTLVISGSSGAGQANTMAMGIAGGRVAPCEPVDDTRPAPPGVPAGKDGGGPSLNERRSPDRGTQQGND